MNKLCRIVVMPLSKDEETWLEENCVQVEDAVKTLIRTGMAKEQTTAEEK